VQSSNAFAIARLRERTDNNPLANGVDMAVETRDETESKLGLDRFNAAAAHMGQARLLILREIRAMSSARHAQVFGLIVKMLGCLTGMIQDMGRAMEESQELDSEISPSLGIEARGKR
jgi:hypothetical protein